MRKTIGFLLLIFLIGGKSAEAQEQITFKLTVLPNTNSVHLVGDFNDWSKTANPMSDPDGDGTWETTLTLKPGEYEYRFLVDDMIWIKDPGNQHWAGEYSNSILQVKSSEQPELKILKPGYGKTISTSNFTIEAQYTDGVRKHRLDLSNTKVLLNGKPQKFSYNQKSGKIECYLREIEDGEYSVEIHAQDLTGNRARPIRWYFLVNNENEPAIVDAGYTIIAAVNSMVYLNSGSYYDPDYDPIRRYDWKLISKPLGSTAKRAEDDIPFPGFKPDQIGRYVFSLQIADGKTKSNIDSVDVYAFIKRDYPVEFSLTDSAFSAIYETSIDSVSIAGEFNRWSAIANPMNDYNHDGVWTAWLDLDPGEYEYKFVVNGEHWIADPNNPVKVPDGWNGFNSVITASLNLAPVIDVKSTFGPGKIIFDASASYSKMGRRLNYFWYQDINNPQRFDLPSTEKISFPTPKKPGTYYYYLVVTDQHGVSSQHTMVLSVDKSMVKIRDFSDSPDWAKDAIVYEVFVRKFTPNGDLKGLIDKVPYLKTLGINCIWLMPIWEGPTAHGYGPTNFFDIEQEYGSLDDFKQLIETAHQAGIRIILDFIANHTSDQHPYFLSAYHNPFSAFRDWYRWLPSEKFGYYSYEFHNDWDTLPNLNYENPNVRRYIISAAAFWAKLGVDGFRCDVAWGVPHDFWKSFRRSLKNINPDFLIIDEVLPRSPAYHKDQFDMSYDTDFYGNLLDVMNGTKPLSAIEYGLKKTQKNYPSYTLDFRYIENHDMDRFITRFGENKTKLAAALLLTIPGTPLIYYGQEIGLTEKTPSMEWNKPGSPLFQFYRKLIHLRRHALSLRRGEMIKVPNNTGESVYAYLRKVGNESFLIVLNFGDKLDDCQLLFPKDVLKEYQKDKLDLENVMTSERVLIPFMRTNQIKLKLAAETAYIFKLLN